MDVEIVYRPSFSMGLVKLAPGEEVRVESGAMVAMSEGVTIQTQATGGILKSLARSFLGGESFFQNVYQAPAHGGEVSVAPTLPGDMLVLDLRDETLLVQSGSYLASSTSVEVSTQWGGAKTFFGGEGLVMLRLTGNGKLVLASYGAIHERDLAAGETYTVDTGHLVAFSADMAFHVRSVGGLRSTVLSGEGLVCDLTGPGRLLMQTRSVTGLVGWLSSVLPFQRGE